MRRPFNRDLSSRLLAAFIICLSELEAIDLEVASSSELEDLPTLQAGDRVILEDGIYNDVDTTIEVNGTSGNKVEILARTTGGPRFTGGTRIVITGDHAVLSGLRFDGNGGPIQKEGIVKFEQGSSHLTLQHCLFRNFDGAGQDDTNWLFVEGFDHLITHCSFEGKTSTNSTIFIKPTEGSATKSTPRNHVLSFCYFGPRTEIGDNGYEAIRLSDSSRQDYEMNCLIESNYFFQTISSPNASEIEVISSKARGNIYRGNVFEDCDGQLTLRHGRNCIVEENAFLGTGGDRESGIRVVGTGHIVRNNYIENVRGTGLRSAICVMDGEYGLTDNQYEGVENCLVEGNVIVNCKSSINFGESKGLDDPPRDVTLKNNRIYDETGGTIFEIEPDVDFTSVMGNIVYSDSGDYGDTGLLSGGFNIDSSVDLSLPYSDIVERNEVGHIFGLKLEQAPVNLEVSLFSENEDDYAKLRFPSEGGQSYEVRVTEDLQNWAVVPGIITSPTAGVQEVDINLDELLDEGVVTNTTTLFFIITVYEDPPVSDLVFIETDGEVVIEAESFSNLETNGDDDDWAIDSEESGSVGSYLETTTGSRATWETGAEASYLVNFTNPGTYYFHPRVMADDGSSDSFFFGLEGNFVGQDNTGETSGWEWDNNETEGIVIPNAGNYLFNIRRRESGLLLDRFILTTDSEASFSGNGPAASERVTIAE